MVHHFPKFYRIVLLSALCVIGFGARSQNLKVNFTFTDNTTRMVNLVNSLADAFDTLANESKSLADALAKVKEMEVSAGMFSQNDWQTLYNNKSQFTEMKKFVITNGVNSVANIPKYANNSIFNVALEHISISKVNQVGNYAFAGLTNLSYIDLPNATNITTTAFLSCTSLVSIDFPNVTHVGKMAFNGCTNLVDVKIPNLKTVIESAFLNCSSLMSIDFPNVTEIGKYAFQGCSNLSDVKLPKIKILPYHAFRSCSSLKSVEFVSVDSLDQYPFYECSSLESIKLPNVTKLALNSLRDLTALKVLEMDALQILPTDAIYSCNSLESLHLPALEQVNYNGVRNCSGLKSISLPKVKTLYYIPFHASPNIAKLMLGANPPAVTGKNSAFAQLPKDRVIVLVAPDGTPLTGADYDAAKTAYLDVDDGKTDELWWGWSIAPVGSRFISIATLQNGTITPSKIAAVSGEEVTLTIIPAATTYRLKAGSLKVHKTGDETVTVAVTGENKFTMPDYDVTVTAEFELIPTYTIAATANPTEGGTVSGAADYLEGADVTLTATPNAGYKFIGWSNGENASPYTFTAAADLDITANFVPIEVNNITLDYTTLLRKVGETPVLITATIEPADALDKFLTWNSDDEAVATVANGLVTFAGVGSTNITATATNGVLATCAVTVSPVTYAISVDANITNGSITPDKTEASANDPITLTVTPDPNYRLVAGSLKYNGNDVTENAGVYTFIMPAESVEITAQFEQMGYIINVTANPAEGGVVSGAGTYSDGETITITATPNAGYIFKQWNDNNTESSRSVVVSGNADYIAEFEEIVLNSISLNPATLTIPSTSVLPYDIMVVFDPEDALNKEVDWNISDPSVIRNLSIGVSSTLSIGPAGPGTATITATSRANPNLVATCEVTVVDGDLPVQGVSLNQSSLTLLEGRAFQLKATTNPENASNQKMTWTCTDESVVTISPSAYYCFVVAKSAGTATVTVKTEDGGFEASCDITVIGKSITLNTSSVTLNIAESHQLEATVLPAELDQNVIWTSNNEAVATVTNGMIAAVAKGTAIITALGAEGLEAYCVVNVNDYTQPDAIATFDDLTLPKADTFWTGASNPDGLFTSFVSGTYRFVNTSGWGGTYWAGFAYTNTTATDAANWNTTNVGTGIDGSENYGVAYYSSWDFPTGITVERTNTTDAKPVSGMYVTNTAQVIDVLNNGNAFARKFEPGDWFKITAIGDNGNSLDFYLADFRAADPALHYIVEDWEWFDLTPLGDVHNVSFTMNTSDVGAYGMNTPTYFALDNFGGNAPNIVENNIVWVSANDDNMGSVSGEGTYQRNTTVELVAAPKDGYRFVKWTENDVEVSTDATFTFTCRGGGERTFVAVFELQTYNITVVTPTNGTLTASKTADIAEGEEITLTATPDDGYQLKAIKAYKTGDANTVVSVDNGKFTMPAYDVTVEAEFEKTATTGLFYNITVATLTNGTLTASKTADIAEGEEITLTATPDDGYQLKAIKAYKTGDANTAVSVDNGKFTMPAYDVTVEAEFEKTATTGLFSIERESLTLTAYPNPTVGAVQVEANGTVLVYNAAGQLLQRVPSHGKVLIDLSNYPAGFYFIVAGKAKATIVKQ